jgi:hypothetical protein
MTLPADAIHPSRPHRSSYTSSYTPEGSHAAREGHSRQWIAERQGKGTVSPGGLAITNGHAVNVQPRPGERLKIVTVG